MPDLLGDLMNAIKGRQDQARRTVTQVVKTADASADVVGTYAERSKAVESDVLKRREKALHARKLSESGSFWDMATLSGLAMLDPGGYDPKIRARRNAEDSDYLSMLGATTNVQLEALKTNLATSQARLSAAEVNESIALEQAQLATTVNQLRTNELTSSLQLQESQLALMTPEEIKGALTTASVGADKLNVNGVEIPRIKLIERDSQLESQRVARLVLKKADNDVERRLGQETFVRSMSRTELASLRANNYVVDGQLFDQQLVDTWYQTKVQNETDLIQEEVRRIELQHQPQTVVTEAAKNAERIGIALAKDSPMQLHVQKFKTTIGMSQTLVDSGSPPLQAAGIAAVTAGLETFRLAAAEQAKIDSPTDKEMQQARFEYYTSGQIPSERIAAVTVERLKNDKPLVGVLSAEDEKLIRNLYRQVYQQMSSEATAGEFGVAPKASEIKEMKSEAALIAWDKWRQERGGQIADSAFANQVSVASIPGAQVMPHPLYGVETPLQFRRKELYAKQMADEIIMNSYGLSRDQLDSIISTGEMPKDSQTTIHQLMAERDHNIAVGLMKQYTPEQGKAILDWMGKYGDTYIGTIVDSAASGAGGFENAASLTLAKDAARDEFYSTVDSLNLALDSALAEPAEQIANFAFGDPEPYQAVALQMSEALTDPERSLLWNKYIAPVVLKAQEMRLRGPEAHQFIERMIGSLEVETPEEKKAYKAFMRDRKKAVESIDSMMNGMFFFLPRTGLTSSGNLRAPSGVVRPSPMMGSPESILGRSANALPFYKEYLKNKPKMVQPQ